MQETRFDVFGFIYRFVFHDKHELTVLYIRQMPLTHGTNFTQTWSSDGRGNSIMLPYVLYSHNEYTYLNLISYTKKTRFCTPTLIHLAFNRLTWTIWASSAGKLRATWKHAWWWKCTLSWQRSIVIDFSRQMWMMRSCLSIIVIFRRHQPCALKTLSRERRGENYWNSFDF